MSPLFGSKDARDDDVAAMNAEIERVDALSLQQLAMEVMTKGFGPDGPGGPGKPGSLEDLSTMSPERLGINQLARQFTPAWGGRGVGLDLQRRLEYLIAEGLQVLESAGLVRVNWQGGQVHYMATRRGRSAIADNNLERALAN